MNTFSRNRSALLLPLLAGALLATATAASAGTNPAAVQASKEREAQRREDRREQRLVQREARAPQMDNRGAAPAPPRMAREDDSRARSDRSRNDPPRADRPRDERSRDDGVRYEGPRFGRDRDNDRDRVVRVPQSGRDYRAPTRNYRPVPPRRYVPALPVGYQRYHWQGRPYYYSHGHWYRPWGSQFAIVAPPIGLFVSYLPGSYSSFWYGGSRYYFADDTYYLYEPARRGYIVTRSPYGDDRRDEDATFDDDELYVYPARGQSEQQQADDRYECHRWAVGETGYDPVEGEYDPDERADYLRAMGACLTGRGYTVR
jgi:hypothetical protein